MIENLILDLDGTLYLGEHEVPGAADFVARMNEVGVRCLFVTNRANRFPAEICSQLGSYGIICCEENVLTSAQATAEHLEPGSAFVVGEYALMHALHEAGFSITAENPDYVIVGFDRTFTYDKMRTACRLISRGSRFIATNADQYLKMKDGNDPGTGTIVAAIEIGSGQQPLVIGKPRPTMVELALERYRMSRQSVVMVGDNLATDIPAGAAAGVNTALILTGVSTRDEAEASSIKPTWIVEDFTELHALVANRNRQQ